MTYDEMREIELINLSKAQRTGPMIRADGMYELYEGIQFVNKHNGMRITVRNPAPWQRYSPDVWEIVK
jgi:hypothetical protein